MRFVILLLAGVCLASAQNGDEKPLRIAIAGLEHGHVDGFLRAAQGRPDVAIVGIFDPDPALFQKYAKKFNLAGGLAFTDLGTMLDHAKPEAVAIFTGTYGHAGIVKACAARKIPVMMEKPLAVSMDDAHAIERDAKASGIPVIVNYETTWYRSHGAIRALFDSQAPGRIRKMVAMDGHEGPHEIHVPPEFFAWLSDPARNGAGALFDFGCYGANLMTWMMGNQRPIAITALTHTNKPDIYSRVDDEATVLVQYPSAQGIIQASWNWPFSRKDFEVYGEKGYAIATGGNSLRVRLPGQNEETRTLEPLPADERDSISYLKAVARGKIKPAGLSSLENNLIVTQILTAARDSARSGKTIRLD